MYQYIMQQADEDCLRLLPALTFLPMSEVLALQAEHRNAPEKCAGWW
jgi:tyrosyl-tRNA synthetase